MEEMTFVVAPEITQAKFALINTKEMI